MLKIQLFSPKNDKSVFVSLEGISADEYEDIKVVFINLLKSGERKFMAIAKAFQYAVTLCPNANPSDLWQHVIYRTYIAEGNNV